MKRKILWLGLSFLLVVALVLASCGPAQEDAEQEEEEVSSLDTNLEASETGSSVIHEMLSLIPDTPLNRNWVSFTSCADIRDTFNVSRPAPDADTNAIRSYIDSIYNFVSRDPLYARELSFISGMGTSSLPMTYIRDHHPIRRENVGFGPQDVDYSIFAGGFSSNLPLFTRYKSYVDFRFSHP